MTRDAAPVLRSIHPDDTKRVLTSVVESADKLTEWSCEFRINTPANGEMWLDGRAVPQREDDGSILWYGYVTASPRASEQNSRCNRVSTSSTPTSRTLRFPS